MSEVFPVNIPPTATLAHVNFENNTPNDCTGCP
jgi:hypothetical protein